MSHYAWVIGGTSESVKIAELLSANNFSCLVSVTTTPALKLYSHISDLIFNVGKIETNKITDFLKGKHINLVIDASHPYAVTISQGAISACKQHDIPYLRYERLSLERHISEVIELENIETLLKSNYLHNQRVLLTLGYKSLNLFKKYHSQAELFARILPYHESLNMALEAGFSGDRLIAIRPPLSFELEKALWELWRISVVVTKASGTSGGEDIKLRVAQALKIPLIVIARPQINYPQVTDNIEEILTFVEKYF